MVTKKCLSFGVALCFLLPTESRADFWGGDVVVLQQILQNSISQLAQLQQLLGTGQDTLNLLHEVNRGLNQALRLKETINSTMRPGAFSDLQNINSTLQTLEDLYGKIPNTSEKRVQQMTDQTVAEAIQLHNEAFSYADRIDPEAERIKDHALLSSPAGATKLTAQSIGVMIHVLNQILRTNAAMLKLQGEQLALNNRKGKIESAQFKAQYDGMARGLKDLKPTYELPSLQR